MQGLKAFPHILMSLRGCDGFKSKTELARAFTLSQGKLCCVGDNHPFQSDFRASSGTASEADNVCGRHFGCYIPV